MLEIFYDKVTKQVIAWRSNDRPRKLRTGEAKVSLDISPSSGTARDYIYDGTLTLRPDYVPPEPARDLATEIDDLKAEIEKLKGGIN